MILTVQFYGVYERRWLRKALTRISISQVVGGPIHGLLLLFFPSMAAMVMVVVDLVWWHTLQGIVVQVHGVRTLWCQCGDGALHGACVWDGLQNTWWKGGAGRREQKPHCS